PLPIDCAPTPPPNAAASPSQNPNPPPAACCRRRLLLSPPPPSHPHPPHSAAGSSSSSPLAAASRGIGSSRSGTASGRQGVPACSSSAVVAVAGNQAGVRRLPSPRRTGLRAGKERRGVLRRDQCRRRRHRGCSCRTRRSSCRRLPHLPPPLFFASFCFLLVERSPCKKHGPEQLGRGPPILYIYGSFFFVISLLSVCSCHLLDVLFSYVPSFRLSIEYTTIHGKK
ncbi:unnamed protein product, partial [Urochloa humidicola]